MQVVVAIALTVFYVGLSLLLGGVRPRSGMPWWFLVPCIVTACAAFVAVKISPVLPVPWLNGRSHGSPPRRVHLSWRAAVRIPAQVPVFLVPWHFLTILRYHFALGWVLRLLAALALAVLALVALWCRRHLRLLRDGEVATALVRDRQSTEEWSDQITYIFRAADGTTVSSWAWECGYGVPEDASVPVFYDAGNPRKHVVASASWFEAE